MTLKPTTEDNGAPRPTPIRWEGTIGKCAIIFPIGLWMASTFFLFGQTGKYLDDWYYLQRDPATGQVQSLILDRPIHFWRPLYRVIVPTLMTELSDADALHHLICALAHGLVVALLWRLLLILRINPLGAALGALLFMVWPAYFEAVLWLCALPTLLSAACVVGAWLACAHWARRGAPAYIGYCVIPVLFFLSACLNEQATCGLAVLPFIYLAARPCSETIKRSAIRAFGSMAMAAFGLALYVVIHLYLRLRLPATNREAFFSPIEAIPGQAEVAVAWMRAQFTSGDFLFRAYEAGCSAIAAHPFRATILGVLLLIGLVAWAFELGRPIAQTPRAQSGWLAVSAVVAFVAPTTPIVVFAYWLNPRVAYAPGLGAAFLIGSVSTGLASIRSHQSQVGRTIFALFCGAILIIPAVMMIGFQWGYQRRWEQDRREIAQLRSLVPDPPASAVFAPVRIDPPPTSGGRASRYDHYFWSPFNAWWSARWIIKSAYARNDVTCGDTRWDQFGITRVWQDRAIVRGIGEVPWNQIIPFVISADGTVTLVHQISAGSVTVTLPHISAPTNGVGTVSLVLPPGYSAVPIPSVNNAP